MDMNTDGDCSDTSDVSDISDIIPVCDTTTSSSGTIVLGHGGTKKHFCLYCKLPYSKIARHLEDKHSHEVDVAKILAKNKDSIERKVGWAQLRKKGDFNHNFDCVEKGHGILIPKYCGKGKKTQEDFVTCGFCLGLYTKRILWRHQKICKAAAKKTTENKGIAAGKLLMPVKAEQKLLRDKILVDMNDGEVKDIVEKDRLILEFGNRLLEKHPEPHKKTYISNKLRELARLLQHTQHAGISSIHDCVDPYHFEVLLVSVKDLAGYDKETKLFTNPSLALKLGYSLKKCCKILRSEALRNEDDAKQKKCDNFFQLYDQDWCDRIARHAHATLDTRKYNTPKHLPFTEDVKKVHSHLRKLADKAKETPEKSDSYKLLAQVCLTQIILFNRRRSGESQRIKVEEVQAALKMGKMKECDSEVVKSLNKFEQQLYQSHTRVETKGKRGRKVPVLLTDEMKSNVNVLLQHKKEPSEFLFTLPGCAHPLRGTDCLRKFANECGAKHPELLTSTRLRQQLATLSQVLGLSETSQDILATFLGHDIRVHRSFYRLPEDVLQTAKVTKILHCINKGQVSDMKGKDFDAINFDADAEIEDDCEDDCSDPDCDIDQTASPQIEHRNTDKRTHSKKRKHIVDFSSSEESDGSDHDEILQSKKKKRKWSDAENHAIKRQLFTFLRDHKVPGKSACEEAITAEKALQGRDWKAVKFHVKNQITSMRRKINH